MTDEQQLRERAAKAWRWRLVLPGLLGGLGTTTFGDLLFRNQQGRHHSVFGAVVAAVLAFAIIGGILVFVNRRYPRLFAGNGRFAAPLLFAVCRQQRRAAVRAVRGVRPSDDPSMRLIERDLAHRSVRGSRPGAVAILIVLLVLVLLTTSRDLTPAGRVCLPIVVAILIMSGVRAAHLARQAKLYLQRVEPPSETPQQRDLPV